MQCGGHPRFLIEDMDSVRHSLPEAFQAEALPPAALRRCDAPAHCGAVFAKRSLEGGLTHTVKLSDSGGTDRMKACHGVAQTEEGSVSATSGRAINAPGGNPAPKDFPGTMPSGITSDRSMLNHRPL